MSKPEKPVHIVQLILSFRDCTRLPLIHEKHLLTTDVQKQKTHIFLHSQISFYCYHKPDRGTKCQQLWMFITDPWSPLQSIQDGHGPEALTSRARPHHHYSDIFLLSPDRELKCAHFKGEVWWIRRLTGDVQCSEWISGFFLVKQRAEVEILIWTYSHQFSDEDMYVRNCGVI